MYHADRPNRHRDRETAVGPVRAHAFQLGLGLEYYLPATGRWVLVQSGHLARCLPAAGSRLAPSRPYAY
jgi:hypothetical protein